MGCVNTNSKEFKDTAKRLNVHPSALEGIVHEFINTKGNEDLFPSDDYIQKRLKGEAVKISAEDLELCTLKGWRNTQYFGNYNAMVNQMTEMQKFLPKGMVIGGRDHAGNYTISLAPLVLDGVKLTPIRQEYQGKLIYSPSDTGKSSIADNKTVFDSDAILGEIIGVSPETARFFFNTLSNKQKEAFKEKYKEKIRQKIEDGFTVLTGDESLLEDADVIIYNKSAHQTDKGVNNNSEITDKIKALKNNDKKKEYLELDKNHYISSFLLSDPNFINDIFNGKTDKGRTIRQGELRQKELISNFLKEFGISINKLNDYNGDIPLFDALNRTINASSKDEITDAVGYAIAFMMQGDPEMQKIIVASHGMRGDYNKKIPIINKSIKNLHPTQNSPVAKEVLKEVGEFIAKEIRSKFGSPIEKNTSKSSIWNVIKNFFKKLGMKLAAFGQRNYVQEQESLFVKDIINALGREDFSRIKGPRIKEGTTELAQKVDIATALKENPFEEEIIRKLGEHDIALAGSASIALQGSLFRPLENPLHDIDFSAGDNSSKESLDKLLPTIFPKNQIDFASMITKKGGNNTVTYVTLNTPFITVNKSKSGYVAEYYSPDGKYLGKKEGSELYLEKGVKGKLLDFFVGPTRESEHGYYKTTINDHDYLISESSAAWAAKILWARPKDMWDYKNFKRYDFEDSLIEAETSTENTGEFSTLDNDIYADAASVPKKSSVTLKKKRMQEEWKAIKTNKWILPKSIQSKIEKKLNAYTESKETYYKGDVDITNYFGKENKTTAKSVLEYIAKNSTDSVTRKLAARLLKNLGNNGEVSITFGDASGNAGLYKASDHSIAISKDALRGKTLKEALVSMEGTIIHEIAHAITVNTMVEDSKSTKELSTLYKEYTELADQYGLNLGYAAANQKEFVAEFLGNKFFREVLMALPSNTNKKVSIGRKILNFILEKIFGITPKDTFYHRADKVIQQLLDYSNNNGFTRSQNSGVYADAAPKKFVFNDGTTVDAPFKPNAQQTTALNAMDDFIKSDKNVMTLSGYAGTGKTSLMEMIAKKCRQEGKDVIFCASTNKAAAVLNDKVSRSHFEAKTLHKIFGITVKPNLNTEHYDVKQLQAALKSQDELVEGSTVIIDESSMINQWEYDVIKGKAEEHNCKIIFVGDEAQLAPVNEDKTSVVFRQNDGKVERLTQVERTGDNAILKEATAIRDGKSLSGKTSFNDKGEGVAYITPQNTKAIDAVINAFIPGLQNDPNHFRILAYTNAAVASYNDRVRRALGYSGAIPRVGEPMMGYDNWGWNKITKNYELVNSESYKVSKIGETETVSRQVGEGKDSKTVEFQVTYITLENPLGEEVTVPFIDVKENRHNRESAIAMAKELNALQQKLNEAQKNTSDPSKRKKIKAELLKKIGIIRDFLFINDNIIDKDTGTNLASKVIDFGYAMTVHKSQGSTFKNVLLDDANIKESKATTEEKQQLEYVGVSRATDTVTVISNNVKKEGTPMQYNKSISTSTTTNTRAQESSERKVTMPPTINGKVQPKETFSIKVDNSIHIYNSRGEEVFNRGTEEDTRNRNKVIANYRIQEGSAVRVQLTNKEGKPILTKDGKPEEVVVYKDGTMISIKDSPGEELFANGRAKSLPNYQATLKLAEQKFEEKNPSRIPSTTKEDTRFIDTRTQEGLDKAKKDHKQLVVDMGNDANATKGIRTAIAGAKKGITLKDALGSHSPFFTQEEIDQIEASIPSRDMEFVVKDYNTGKYKTQHIKGKLEIVSVSRQTDPVFFADRIIEFLKENGKKPLNDPTRTVAMEIWSKHDGLPLRRIMEACKKYRVAPMLSFSITGLGGTALEKGVMKYNDMLDKIEALINEGVIDPTTTTIRIDPILIGETKLEDIRAIVERAKGMGIKKFVTSLVQSYGFMDGTSNDHHVTSGINKALAEEGRSYDWDKYYGKDARGNINHKPKQEYIEEIGKFLVELNKDPNIEIQSCAFGIRGLKPSACLDPYIIQAVTGVNVADSYVKDSARKYCECYGVHQDFFRNFSNDEKICNSSCAYCYAKHSGDNNMRYYDNNGKLIDNVFTRTSESQNALEASETTQNPQENKPKQDKSITKKENKNFMEKSSRISTMRNNLNNSSLLKASEVRKIGEKVVDWISDYITSLLQNPEEIARVYGENFKDIDVSSMSRAELVNTIGIENIFKAAKDKLNSERHEEWTYDVASKADELYDNFDALIYLAHDRFAENEGFSISLSTDGNKYEVNTEINEDADNFNASNKESDISEIEKDQQEHWQVETKTRDVIDSMNKLVKDTLRQCLVLDSKGEPVRDEFGFNEKVDIREAVNFIYNTTKGSLTLGDMISKLKEKVEEYPWLTQLLDKLKDTTGEYNDLQSQFFGDMFKPFQSYHVVIKEGGKFKSIPVNENPVLQESLNSVKSLYYIGEHPLFITQSEINHKTFNQLKERVKALDNYTDVTDSNIKGTVAGIISEISQCLGYSVTPEIIATGLTSESLVTSKTALANIIEALEKLDNTSAREKVNYDAFSFKNDISIRGNLKTFLSPIVQHFEDIAMAATYDDGKMYQSYVTPSYLSKLMIKFATTDEATFKDFIQSEYGQYSWFWDSTNNSWNNDWLEQLDKNPEARKIFKHKVQLNFDGKHYMKGMSDAEYALSVFTEYFGDGATGSEKTLAWFRIPMQSNKPSSEFIQFYSDRSSFYKRNLTNKLFKVFCQELSRIQTVTERNLSKSDKGFIANFDKNGNKFHFLEYMNKYLDGELKNTELGQLLRKKIAGEGISDNTGHLAELVKEAIGNEMEAKVTSIVDGMYESGIAQAAIDNLPGFSKEVAREKLENFVWNDTFAAINILQLTVTDIAFYKNAEDLQKRLAEIHAPGIRGRVDATDYNGRKVSDGNYRAIKLADFDKVTSNIIENLTIVFDRRIANAKTEAERKGYEVLKESLVGEKGLYRDINVTDAQAYNCPTSYRKKAIMFGKWSKDAEKVWETLASGKANLSDIKVAFQPLKPTVFSHSVKNVGTKNSTMNNLKVPIYYKNSEYLLIMADAILRGENTGKPNLLRALFEVMEESHFTTDKESGKRVYKTDGIDTIIFESGVKSGLGGQVSLNDLVYSANGEALAKERLEAAIYNSDGRYNTDTVDIMAFEDYCLQQEVPEHFKDHAQVFGSQLRYIGISELESIDASGEAVKYHIGKDAEGKTAQELKEEYENLIAQNIQESMDELYEELCVGEEFSLEEKNAALSKILQREILASPRYGIDLLQACSINENGEFNIPLGDPIQSKRVQQLINSIIKNRINKQKIAGGPVVQVTSFGTSTELGIKFKDGKGGLLLTRKEWENSSSKEHATYDDYIKENQKGIAYMEVLAPAYASDILRKFTGSDGVVNVKALEMLDPELLEMIGYRIPTEEKYSAAPLKIVGFLPREAGEGIMLPYDITLINGSDYDVDKEYIMRKVLDIKVKPEYANKEGNINKTKMYQLIWNDLIRSQAKEGKEKNLGYTQKTQLSELVKLFLDDPFNEAALTAPVTSKDQISMTKGAYNRMLKTYLNAYEVEHPGLDTKEGRDNRIIDILNSVLTHETSTENVLNPGGFEEQKKMGYLVEAIRNNPELTSTHTWEELENMSIDELKELSSKDKNLCYINTQFQFYKQNSAAGSLIGIFAVNRTAHAAIESGSIDGSATYFIDGRALEEKDGFENVSIDGISLGTKTNYEVRFDMRKDANGMPIGKTLGSLVGASADAVKDPVLNLMNINSDTANVLNALLRVGVPFRTAALFLSQGSISRLISRLNMQRLSDGYGSLSDIAAERFEELNDQYKLSKGDINSEDLSIEDLIDGIKGPKNSTDAEQNKQAAIEYKVLKTLIRSLNIADALRLPTFATRFNSITSAVGPLVIDNLITEMQGKDLNDNSLIRTKDENGKAINIKVGDILNNHPILNGFAQGLVVARRLFSNNSPLNSTNFRDVLDWVSGNFPSLKAALISSSGRTLFNTLGNIYQTMLLYKTGVLKSEELGYFINDFPKEFMKKDYKNDERFQDNELIKLIRYTSVKGDNSKTALSISTTSLDTTHKEKLSNALIDLYKTDQEGAELAIKLFKYNVFKGGIDFSPKTFTHLFPSFIKERIPGETSESGYIDTFRKLPELDPATVIDMLVRNNYDNNRLAPVFKDKAAEVEKANKNSGTKVDVSDSRILDGVLEKFSNGNKQVTLTLEEGQGKSLIHTPYFKMYDKEGNIRLFSTDVNVDNIGRPESVTITEISKLGNGKEYMELYNETNHEALSEKESNVIDESPNDITPTQDGSMDTMLNHSVDGRKVSTAELVQEALKYSGQVKKEAINEGVSVEKKAKDNYIRMAEKAKESNTQVEKLLNFVKEKLKDKGFNIDEAKFKEDIENFKEENNLC